MTSPSWSIRDAGIHPSGRYTASRVSVTNIHWWLILDVRFCRSMRLDPTNIWNSGVCKTNMRSTHLQAASSSSNSSELSDGGSTRAESKILIYDSQVSLLMFHALHSLPTSSVTITGQNEDKLCGDNRHKSILTHKNTWSDVNLLI
jgi:hypothetical protein